MMTIIVCCVVINTILLMLGWLLVQLMAMVSMTTHVTGPSSVNQHLPNKVNCNKSLDLFEACNHLAELPCRNL